MNPFRYGALALDDAFTNREDEIRELTRDILNGQDVVVLAPRRFGKTSLVWRVIQEVVKKKVLVAQVNLMTTPTKERLAEKLADSIYENVASALFRARERLRIFADLRIRPIVTIDPETGTPSFSFDAGYPKQDVDATIERLLELPGELAAERKRKVALVFDEFQEVVAIDPDLPKLMRSVFQEQPEVAHVYLGSKRHMMERIFNDENEPFWRSARQMELGVIDPPRFEGYLVTSFERTGKKIAPETVAAVLETTGGHPYATQELCYFLWEETPKGRRAGPAEYERALADVLRAEHAHFELIWDQASTVQRLTLQALSRERGRPLSGDYRRRHKLPGASTVQRALQALTRNELVNRADGEYRIAEPFVADWLRREA
ncbi:MAG: ATP-binding protein [Actinobacteria bacterium]|nr:MAG: ATP-binding protein [Actinomycetota bacterium]